MEIYLTYHPAWLLLGTVVAFAYSFFLYRKDELLEEVKSWVKWVMAVFRFTAVWLIFLLLLGIIFENFVDRKEKPLIFIAHDQSESVLLNKDSVFYQTEYIQKLKELSTHLQQEYDVVEYSFAESLTEGIEGDYNGKMTDIAQVFNQIFDQYTNRNIGAIIMSTDGIYNTGSNPVYAVARKSFLPIFSIGLGDTNQVRDVKIDQVKHNDIAFLGNQFPVDVILSQSKCGGESVKVGIYNKDRLLEEKRINFQGEEQQVTAHFVLNADRIGYQKYTTRVTVLSDEFSKDNNVSNFYLEIIDGRQKLLIAHNGPHPDISAFRYVIENNKNYEVEVKNIDEVRQTDKYDLLILHNYQPTNSVITEAISTGSAPCLFVVGNKTSMSGLQTAQIGLSGIRSDFEEVGFSANSNYKDILLTPATLQLLSTAPPLQAPFGSFNFSGAIDVLAYQKVGNIVLDDPLIYFTKKNASRIGVIMGEGIWRWRLYDQARNGTTANFEDFVGKLITYLAIKENKDPFKVHLKNEYSESEDVIVKAELYNKSFELINEPEVKFEYTNEQGKTFEPYFVRIGSYYQLDLGKMPQGIYTWKASTDFQNRHYEKAGTFLVREVMIEALNNQANHRLLMNLAENSGGEFYLPRELERLEKDIAERDDLVTVVYQEKTFNDLIDYKWLFFLIVFLFSLEWFMRKYHGAY
ncbi:MAG: hypothetical protein HUJ25_10020 [Crocinitomicaceae bacterium]|nr:hypothetical protein [Crocinitomicaceae bacterium]